MTKGTTFIEIIFQILFAFNRISFVSNYWIYELFGTKWTHPRELASVPQTHRRQGHTSFIHSDAAELCRGRRFSPPFSVFLNSAFCAPAKEAREDVAAKLPPRGRETGAARRTRCSSLWCIFRLSQPDTTHYFYLNTQDTSKRKIWAAQMCWRTLLCLLNTRGQSEPHLQLRLRVLPPADSLVSLRYSFCKGKEKSQSSVLFWLEISISVFVYAAMANFTSLTG